ncbi:hypothetical protein SAMN04488135_101250 [Pollutimonas bauzanensis]|uniref:Uncharacterized protein n=1 Tax=Pollutimonas bauzanensis TaxID=658167 RepID=A0A1M5MKH3_9BURK|nr:hypothetical protein [Pollutimonas bauzanensis]SHG77880.1 hypothetical protein SAMN04488135_101250 [Pollutimonas bauzanensis]
MSIQSFSRCGVALLFGALVGCSFTGPEAPGIGTKASDAGTKPSARGDNCRQNRSGCIYEGAYEPRERDYAEQEAKRLNHAALERLRRGSRK